MNFEPILDGRAPAWRGLSTALLPLGLAWRGVSALRRRWYSLPGKSGPGAIPSIVIGSPTVGGSGKTPFTEYVTRLLASSGAWKPGVVVGHAADEAELLRSRLPGHPVLVDSDRLRALDVLADRGATCAVLDGGLEALALRPDVRVVLVPAGQWHLRHRMLPSGPWRTPVSALRPDDVVVITRRGHEPPGWEEIAAQLDGIAPVCAGASIESGVLRDLRSGEPVDSGVLRDRKLLAVAGIARPSALMGWLEEHGAAEMREWHPGDHAVFGGANLEKLLHKARTVDYVVTTEKDAVKLRYCLKDAVPETLFVDVKISWDFGRTDFDKKIMSKLKPGRGKPAVANR